jgi:hypothetical protein
MIKQKMAEANGSAKLGKRIKCDIPTQKPRQKEHENIF